MINSEKIISSFASLGDFLKNISGDISSGNEYIKINHAIQKSIEANGWFTRESINHAIENIANRLTKDKLTTWLKPYLVEKYKDSVPVRNIAVIMAGNLPLVGFDDFLAVISSGNRFIGKLSSDDKYLLPALADKLIEFCPEISRYIEFPEDKISGFDAVIATGSNNTARYFEYYFGKYPHIIRKNRNGVALLTGEESDKDLEGLGEDVFLYFGMGCRSVSKLFVPKDYQFDHLLGIFQKFDHVFLNNKYKNNYDYYRSIYLINKIKHYDSGFIMLTQNTAYSSPPSVLYYEVYDDMKYIRNRLMQDAEQIQCVVAANEIIENHVKFGDAQKPQLWDYADGVDTMEFLLRLS